MNGVCPCDPAREYARCCKPLHQGQPASDAEALMRSRYSAYVLQLDAYLLSSWHASTCPANLHFETDISTRTSWLGLQIKRHCNTDSDHATVEFIARFRAGGGRALRLHERSRFVREQSHWFYLDGEQLA